MLRDVAFNSTSARVTPPQSLPVKHFSGQRHYCYGVTATESVLIRNARERVTRMADAPELNYSDFSVRKATHYVNIDLGGKGAPAAMTGIFCSSANFANVCMLASCPSISGCRVISMKKRFRGE